MKLLSSTAQELSPSPPPSKPPDPSLVSSLPADPPVPPIPPDPPPASLVLLISASEDLISGLVLTLSLTYHLSPGSHLENSKVGFCLGRICSLPKFPKPLPHSISQVWTLRSFYPTYMVLESHVSTCVLVSVMNLALVHLITAVCRFWLLFSSTIPPFVLALKSEFGWGLFLINDRSWAKYVFTLPQYESITQLPQFEAFTNSLASYCFFCSPLFENCRRFQGQEEELILNAILDAKEWTAAQHQPPKSDPKPRQFPTPSSVVLNVFVDAVWHAHCCECGLGWINTNANKTQLSQDSASRRYISSVLIAEYLAIQSALLVANSMGLQQFDVFPDSMSLVAIIRSKEVTNELKSILTNIYCLCDVFQCFSFYYVSCLANTEADAKSVLCNIPQYSVSRV